MTAYIIISVLLIILIMVSPDTEAVEEKKCMNFDKDEMFSHPVTGYMGTRSEMDTYIINREQKLKEEQQ